MTTTARERYEAIVKETETAAADIFEGEEAYSIVMSIPLEAPAEWFLDYTVRDAVMTRSLIDAKFAFILCHKLSNVLKENMKADNPITQTDLETLAVAIQVGAMWEQEQSEMLVGVAEGVAKEENLELPSLVSISKRIMKMSSFMDLEGLRKETYNELMPKLEKALDSK
jgi:hypothetical protein